MTGTIDTLLDAIRDARIVMLGEATHGTHELPLTRDSLLANVLAGPHLERAIGVLYIPRTERQSHYFYARLASQFNFVVHIDDTRAVEPLERSAGWNAPEPSFVAHV